ncbi:hypothetical protein PTE30175_01496 [Pandoraea terrae]|uniref:Uncharacterized protein n=1 Tax=Pandoraea terrae TaxID=1537710 RepID=A0A5E4TRR0_9BURK|nr:hypothetical protein PTE30175_01496 [Pandoraea terrae]
MTDVRSLRPALEKTMMSALLETIGALAILISIAVHISFYRKT